jgi:hypothetical protein
MYFIINVITMMPVCNAITGETYLFKHQDNALEVAQDLNNAIDLARVTHVVSFIEELRGLRSTALGRRSPTE